MARIRFSRIYFAITKLRPMDAQIGASLAETWGTVSAKIF